MSVIGFKKARCKDCYKCVRNCKVKAIRIVDDHIQFKADECVECGQCLASCPQDSIVFIRNVDRIRSIIESGQKTVVSLAPAYLGIFSEATPDQMAAALKKIGFTYVHETAEAAYYVTREYMKFLESAPENGIILTSSCAAINNLIEQYHPDMIPYLAPVVTPAIAHARMLRNQYGPDVKIVYISPCTADAGDALQDARTKGVVDEVLDIRTLRDWLRGLGIKIPELAPSRMDNLDPKVLRLFAVSGGVLSSIKADKSRVFKQKRLYLSNISTCEELFDSIRNGEIENCIVELHSCIGGCINGPMTGGKKSDRFRSKINISAKVAEHVLPDYPPLPEGVDLHKTFEDHKKETEDPTEEQILSILSNFGIDSHEKELNCGACGFDSCRKKAVAVFKGKSEPSLCTPFMYEQARKMSELVISVMPDIIILVDKNRNICEFNNAAEVAFVISSERAIGHHISEIIEDDLVNQVFDNKQSLVRKRVDYAMYRMHTVQNLIYIRDQEKVLIVMRNITSGIRRQEQLKHMKLESVTMAQNVINKQMMVAQQIAGLLGETTAETKSTLRKMRDTLMKEDEDSELWR